MTETLSFITINCIYRKKLVWILPESECFFDLLLLLYAINTK